MFAGSCIGVICLVLVLELLRRVGREYDAFILRRARLARMYMPGPSDAIDPSDAGNNTYQSVSTDDTASKYATTQDDAISTAPDSSSTTKHLKHNAVSNGAPILAGPLPPRSGVLDPYRPSIVEQIVRALLHMLQFAVAYFIMLLAMYFNGYIIICIFIGAFLGSLIFSWEPVSLNKELVLLQNRICLALDGPGC
jgi:copper transporter 1